MKFKGTLWLGVLLAGIVLYYYWIEIPAEQEKIQEQKRSEKLFHFVPEDVQELIWTRNDQTLRVQRTGDNAWKLIHPLKTEADAYAISDYLALLDRTRLTRVVETSPETLANYGLQNPSLKIVLVLKDQNRQALLIGDDHPMGHKLYVKREDEDRVLLTSVRRTDFEKNLYDVRDKTLLDFKPDQVNRVVLDREESRLILEKKGDAWRVSQGTSGKGDADEIRNFLNSFQMEKVRGFIEEHPESLEPYGLVSPALSLTLTVEGRDDPLVLRVGKKTNKENYFAQSSDGENVFLVHARVRELLTRRPVDFLDKNLVEFQENEVAQLTLKTPERDIAVARDPKEPDRWRLVRPEPLPADTATVNSLLFDLRDAKVETFIKTAITDPALFGLAKPSQSLEVSFQDGDSWSLDLGHKTGSGDAYFGRRSGEKIVFKLGKETVEKIFRSLHDLKDKKLLRFDKEQVSRVSVEYPHQTFELIKEGDAWNLRRPEAIEDIEPFLGNDLLWTLDHLEYQSVVSPTLNDDNAGLTQPVVTVTLWNGAEEPLGRVTVGTEAGPGSEHYARVAGDPALYTIKKRFLDELPSTLEKFKS